MARGVLNNWKSVASNRQFPITSEIDLRSERLTIPSLLLARSKSDPNGVALRVKTRGIYYPITWKEYCSRVEQVCRGLYALGLKSGQRVAILGDPCPEWLFVELGTLSIGGICYGIYPTSAPSQVAQLLRHGGASIVVAEDQEQADKLLTPEVDLSTVRYIVVIDTRGMFGYKHPKLISFQQLTSIGQREGIGLDALVTHLHADDPALIIYTSGTTGEPRGAVWTHRALIQGALDYRAALVRPGRQPWRSVAHLPLNHAFEQFNTVILPLVAPVIPHFGEEASRFTETLFEVAPDFYASVPRYWQKLASQVLVGLQETSLEKQAIYNLAMAIGRRYIRAQWAGKRPLWLQALYFLAWHAAFRPLLEKIGLARIKIAASGGGPIPTEVQTLWQIWGVNLKNLYGQTEAGFVAAQPQDFPPPGDIGVPATSVSVRLAPDGEILVRSAASFNGYWQDEESTAQVRQDGWIATGDIGEWTPEGRLRLVDRKKDILITAGGKNVSPQTIENALRASPYINEVVVFGEGRRYLVALIEIDYEAVAQWARGHELIYGSFADLATSSAIYQLIEQEVRKVNARFARVEQIKSFRIIPRELDPEVEGEPITPTRKVKRQLIYERFRDLIESMYIDDGDARLRQHVGELFRR